MTSTPPAAITVEQFPAFPGPRWTRKRLVDMLIACYGPTASGAVNVAAVAQYAGVSESTVHRWLSRAGTPNNRRPAIPARRLTQLQLAPALIEQRSYDDYLYALDAIDKVAAGRIEPAWREQGWLGEHTVAVIGVAGKPWLQVAYSNQSKRSLDELRRRGPLLESVVVPTRHHARALAYVVMLTVRNWRVHPVGGMLKRGGTTTVWMADAPTVNLTELAQRLFP
jgi:hypothetical protein